MNKLLLAAVLATAGFFHDASAQDDAKDNVALIMQKNISDAPGKRVTVITVSYAPGQASEPHSHPGSVFAYVLEGKVVSQLEGEPAPTTYSQGQSWYEAPGSHHIVSRNASATEPAKIVVWAMSAEGEPIKKPLPTDGKDAK